MTPAQLLATALRRDPGRPLVTWYDDATGERVELSVTTAANWAAKTANLMVDELGLDENMGVRLEPPWHWLATVVALGAWTAGITVGIDGDALPGDATEFVAAVLQQPDAVMVAEPSPDAVALEAMDQAWTLADLGASAQRAVTTHGLADGCRVMSVLSLDTVDGIDAGLLLPLAAGGSVVLVAHADERRLAERAATERVTHTAGTDVPGLPRLC